MLRSQIEVMSRCHSCPGRSTLKNPGRRRRGSCVRRWISLRSRITRSTRLRLIARPSLRVDPGGHDPVAVGRVLLGDLDDRGLDLVDRRPRASRGRRSLGRDAVDRLPADLQDARQRRRAVPLGDELTGVGDALGHSHVRNPFPRISSS